MDATILIPSQVLNQSLNQFQGAIHSVTNPQLNVYSTGAVRNQTRILDNEVKHIKLDDQFLSNCDKFRSNFSQRQLTDERSAVLNAAQNGTQFLRSYNATMSPKAVSNLQENQMREQHEWAINNFDKVHSSVGPLANSSHTRIGQFCDWIGV